MENRLFTNAHILAWLQLARRALAEGNPQQAVSCCEKALEYPENYEEGRGVNAREAAVYYYMAKAQETTGHAQDARAWLEKAANYRTGNLDESDFYTGCAMRRLGREQEAAALYRSMLEQADRILREEDSLPYFGRKIRGFDAPDALLTGPETRTSSPVRMTRGEDLFGLGCAGLIPCGEGAGYAGGIMSAAVDGIKAAYRIMEEYAPILE